MNATRASMVSSEGLFDRAKRVLPGGSTRATLQIEPSAPYAASGQGCWLQDVDGRTLLDAQNNYTALIHGHREPAVMAVASEALAKLTCVGLPTASEVIFAEQLSDRVPIGSKWRFCCTGSEAVMYSIRLARAITGRERIVRFADAYHGSYDAVVPDNYAGVTKDARDSTRVLPFNDPEALQAFMAEHGAMVAAIIFDCMPNRAGLRPATARFAEAVQSATRQHGAILIQDEIITFRCEVGGMHARFGIDPDLITLGKVIGGGFPIGAIGGKSELMDIFDTAVPGAVEHTGTFAAHPVALEAGAMATRLLDRAAIARLNAAGDYVRSSLSDSGWDVTGSGSLFRLHVSDSTRLWWDAYDAGVLLAKNGLGCLSTAMDDEAVESLVASLADLANQGA